MGVEREDRGEGEDGSGRGRWGGRVGKGEMKGEGKGRGRERGDEGGGGGEGGGWRWGSKAVFTPDMKRNNSSPNITQHKHVENMKKRQTHTC